MPLWLIFSQPKITRPKINGKIISREVRVTEIDPKFQRWGINSHLHSFVIINLNQLQTCVVCVVLYGRRSSLF